MTKNTTLTITSPNGAVSGKISVAAMIFPSNSVFSSTKTLPFDFIMGIPFMLPFEFDETVNIGLFSEQITLTTEVGYNDVIVNISSVDTNGAVTAPSLISDFLASTDLIGQVSMTFTPSAGYPTPKNDLYDDNGIIAADITSGYILSVGAGSNNYYIKSTNTQGAKSSNLNQGTSVVDPTPIAVQYPQSTALFQGESITITNS